MENAFNICVADKAALLLLDSVSSLAATVLKVSDILREILLTGENHFKISLFDMGNAARSCQGPSRSQMAVCF